VNNGGDYVAARRALLNRYAVKWLSEMHDQDPALYGVLLYEICVEASQDDRVEVDILKMPSQEERKVACLPFSASTRLIVHPRRDAALSDKLLKSIIRLSQGSGVAFGVFDTLFLRWLEHISTMDIFLEVNSTRMNRLLVLITLSPCHHCIDYSLGKPTRLNGSVLLPT
jgi:hypothetical protein